MTKRTGLQRTILYFAVFDILLLIAFLVLHITDTRLADGESAYTDPHGIVPIVTEVQAPEDSALQKGEAEQIIRSGSDAVGRPAQMQLSADGVQFDANLVVGSFGQRGGPDFSLYVDTASFRLTENEGRCYVSDAGSTGSKLYLELAFLPNTDAATVAVSLLNSYGAVTVNPAEKTEAFGGHAALRVTGSSPETDLEAYLIPINNGCLTVVKCVPGLSAEHADRLLASFDSLLID